MRVEKDAQRRTAGPGEHRPRHAQRLGLHEVRLADMVHDVEVERDGERAGAHDAAEHAGDLAGQRVRDEKQRADGKQACARRVDPAPREAADQHRHEQRHRQAEHRHDRVEDGDDLLVVQDLVGLDGNDAGNDGAGEGFHGVERGKGARVRGL